MVEKNRVLITYYSGTGSTEMIVEALKTRLDDDFEVNLVKVAPRFDYEILGDYDYYIFASPVYGGGLPISMQEFLDRLPKRESVGKAMALLTYSYAEGDAMNLMADYLKDRHYCIMSRWSVRGPSTYLRAVFDFPVPWFGGYEKNLKEKLEVLIQAVYGDMYSRRTDEEVMGRRGILRDKMNEMVKHIGMKAVTRTRNHLTVLPDRCNFCFYCVENCNNGCFIGTGDVPELNTVYCEGCLKCVHHCPQKAIVINEKHKDFERLNKGFYEGIKSELMKSEK